MAEPQFIQGPLPLRAYPKMLRQRVNFFCQPLDSGVISTLAATAYGCPPWVMRSQKKG